MTTRARSGRGRRWIAPLVTLCALALSPRAILAAPTVAPEPTIRGTVEATSSRWSGDWIVTDVAVRTVDGRRVSVVEHGGSIDGIGMWVSHRDASLRPGDEVELRADRSGLRARRVVTTRDAVAFRPAPAEGDAPRHGVQRTSRSGRPLYHATGCLSFQYDAAGSSKVQGEWAAFDDAFAAWESASATGECGGLNFHHELVENAPEGRDDINTIRFRDTEWCRPASGTEPAICHSPEAVAVTRVLYVDDPLSLRDGEILEVDIEVNAVDFTLAVDGRATAVDLASAAAHEIGHALGLDHNCGIEGGAWPTDENGDQVESCESASPELVDATMYFQVPPGVTAMRTPEASDIGGLCSVIEARCIGEVTAGCSVGGAQDDRRSFPLGGVAGTVLLLGLVVRRRRRPR